MTSKIASDETLIYWANIPTWTCDEAVKLSFGANPATFNFDYESLLVNEPQFANAYQARLLWLVRSFGETIESKAFEDWSHENKQDIPEVLRAELNRVNAPKSTPSGRTNRQNKLLKIILALAVTGFNYDPKKARDTNVRDMIEDFKAKGFDIREDALRKALNEAAELHQYLMDDKNA